MPIPRTLRTPKTRPWAPLNDLEWHALYPYLAHRSPAGRQVGDLRQRIDAIFHVACAHAPWRDVPERYGKPGTIARYFRRLTHKGLWQTLLEHLGDLEPAHPLRQIQDFIFRACRRAHRILGLGFLVLIRRLGLRSALNGPPWLLPDPDLSETLIRLVIPALRDRDRERIRLLKRTLWVTKGRRSIPRAIRMSWP